VRFVQRAVPEARTPLLLLDLQRVRAQHGLWQRCLPALSPYYAIKANTARPVLELLRDAGACFDAATGGELDLLRALEIGGERIISTHPIRDARDLAAISRDRPAILVVQDVRELAKLASADIPRADYSPHLLVRISLPFSNLDKFGIRVLEPRLEPLRSTWRIDPSPLFEILRAARGVEEQRGARFGGFGLAGHVGTNQHAVAPYRVMLALFRCLAEAAAAEGLRLEIFDLGGGFCDQDTARAQATTQEELLAALAVAVEEARVAAPGTRFLAEPGRFFVADAAALLLGVKSVERRSWRTHSQGMHVQIDHLEIHIDDGIYGCLMGQAHDDKRWPLLALREMKGEGATLPAHVWGATCDTFDRIDGFRELPADLAAGECLLVPGAGAYTLSTSTRFNQAAPTWIWAFEGDEHRGWTGQLIDEQGRILIRR
jgi:ornithine decarboxylase